MREIYEQKQGKFFLSKSGRKRLFLIKAEEKRKTNIMADIEKHNQTDLVAPELLKDLRQIIDAARSHVAATANYELTAMYWHIGNRINNEVLKNERAEYGKQIVSTVVTKLQEEYGTKGFEEKSIRRMMQFAQMFSDFQIVSPLVSKLSWSHFLMMQKVV